ncbi:MAG TPA: sigma 54-interacting transcriptional regulator [Thermoanaerobaculia bacterium]|nr:sigma 54-interacting transcriptional regulator [Thermoanaerobaculia bacterium]
MSVVLEHFPHRQPDIDETSLASVLGEIAETASETLELQEVFERVATSVRRLIPLDNMGVVRILDGHLAVLHATTVECGEEENEAECSGAEPLTSWSPRMRPRPGSIRRLDDARTELDSQFPMDAALLEKGVRSALWEPFRMAEGWSGGVWLSSYRPHAFTEEHQEALRPIAALLGSAVEHWRIWDAERRRRERLGQLETLLGSLVAETLDVREVFERISQAVQPVLPHQALVLTELDDPPESFHVKAMAGKVDTQVPTGPVPLTRQEVENRLLEFEILEDMAADLAADTARNRLALASGMRAWLRVPVRLWGEIRGSLLFLHRDPARYSVEDVEVAGRLADRIALALCYSRLAEEARIAAEARERAERLEVAVETLTRELESRGRGRIVGASKSWKEVLRHVGRVASSETTVLITGESGTGKEIVAHLIRQGSPRVGKPFVAVNCAALPDQLLESELFGYEKGAFTGAVAAKAGRLEQAAGGTLFLDEVAEMSPLVQAKLLRFLQEREFQRLGGTRTLRADVRVIAATNRDLGRLIARQEFREDLYYRLNVFEIRIPPLRERPEDVLLLAEAFLEELGHSMSRPAAGISRDAREWLLAYPWPGNVRELRNAIERAILLCDGGLVTRDHLPAVVGRPETARPAAVHGSLGPDAPFPAGGIDLEAVERSFVERALAQTRGNKSKAARLLGLTRAQLYSRLEKYGLGG